MKTLLLICALLFTSICFSQVQIVQLDGSGSTDPDGSITGFVWTALTTNPSLTIFATPTQARTTVVPQNGAQWKAGTYGFVLTVTDNLGATSKDTVNITFKLNMAPKANAGADQIITVNSVAKLGGKDIPSNDLAVQWSLYWSSVWKPSYHIVTPNAPTTDVTGLPPGIFVFRKYVQNEMGASSDFVRVTVRNKKLL